jgi:hypothetical protein
VFLFEGSGKCFVELLYFQAGSRGAIWCEFLLVSSPLLQASEYKQGHVSSSVELMANAYMMLQQTMAITILPTEERSTRVPPTVPSG